jgi:hypothetical protein
VLLLGIAGKLVYGEVTGDKIPTALTLGAIVAVLAVAVGASLRAERKDDDAGGPHDGAAADDPVREPEAAGV